MGYMASLPVDCGKAQILCVGHVPLNIQTWLRANQEKGRRVSTMFTTTGSLRAAKKKPPPPKQKKTASLYPKLKWHWKRRITFSSQLTIIRLKVCRSQRLNIASDSQDTSLIRIDFQGPGFWFGSIGNIHSRGFRQKRMPYDLECGEYPWNCRLSCIMLHHFSRYESLLELAIDA